MVNVYRAKAYAKVNFNLNVLPKRADGFHNIESIFQTIDLYDELSAVVTEESGIRIFCEGFQLPAENTLVSAYQAFVEITGCKPGIQVELKKGIPAGGGLGGGSADAAALIRLLEKITGIKLSEKQRDSVAEKTGSDVFFFMHCDEEGRGCALVSGRGEKIQSIESRKDLFLLLLFPKISSSTKEAYALVDKMLESGETLQSPAFDDLAEMYRKSPKVWKFTNTFTPVLCKRYDVVWTALSELKKSSAEYAEMSGSGSTVFGVFTNKQVAENCTNLLCETWKCELVQTI